MKFKLFLICIGLCLFDFSFAQNYDEYIALAKEAQELYEAKSYEASAAKYRAAFAQLNGKAFLTDRYKIARVYALIENADSSFYHLFYLAEHPKLLYKEYDKIKTDADFENLYKDARWEKVLEIIKKNKEEFEKDFDRPLMAILDSIYQLDQDYRKQINEIEEKYGFESDEMKAHWNLINKTDSLNLIKVKKILDERGWLGAHVVGRRGNSTLFLVIQHSDLETQLKYLPMMREAVKEGNAQASSLALLEDRVALGQGKRQIYGSQISQDHETGELYVSPLIDPEKVNERRAEVGLGTIEDYVKHWDLTWDVEKHIERTKKLEEKN